MIKKSLPLRVVALTFVLLALPLLIYSFMFFKNSYYEALVTEKIKLREEANLRAYTLAGIFPIKPFLLNETIYFLDLENRNIRADSEAISNQLKHISSIAGTIDFFILEESSDADFPVIASNVPELIGTYLVSYEQIQSVFSEGKGVFIRYIFHPKEKKYVPMLFMASVIDNPATDNRDSILVAMYAIEDEIKQILERTKRRSELNFAVLTDDDLILAASDPYLPGNFFEHKSQQAREQIIETGKLGEIHLAEKSLPMIQGSEPSSFEFVFNNQVQIAHRAPVPNTNISFLAYTSKKTFFVRAIRHFLVIYMIYGMLLILGAAVTFWLTRLISRPLNQLSYVMGKVSQGELNVRFKEQPLGFEINALGGIFNDTLDKLFINIQQAEDERVKKEKYKKEVEIASKVQEALLPTQTPEISGIELAGHYIPSQNVNSDFYGYFAKPNKKQEEEVVISVVDAAGQGISSCLYGLTIRGLINIYSTLSDDLGVILSNVNNAFVEDVGDTGMFATILIGIYNPKIKNLSYYSCGHIPGMVRKEGGHIVFLEHTGMALGLMPSQPYKTDSINLEKGDLVLFYTDGLIDAINDKGQPFTLRRLQALLQQRKWKTANECVEGLDKEIRSYIGSMPLEDDVAFLIMRIVD